MPILYVHGVSVRDETGWELVETLLRRYVAPEIASDPENVEIKYCFWGDQAAKLSWQGSSITNTPVREALHRSADRVRRERAKIAGISRKLRNPRFLPRDDQGKISLEFTPKLKRLRSLSKERLSDFCTAAIHANSKFSAKDKALLAAAADDLVHSEEVTKELANCKSADEEAAVLESRLKRHLETIKHDLKDKLSQRNTWARSIGTHLKEGFTRGLFSPSFAATRVMIEMKQPVAQFVSRFLGDVFTYINKRGDATQPGPIPKCVIDSLIECRANQKKRGGEPIVVLSHSMGGQIMYDVVTHFLPETPELADIRIDFWCASASQVGFFEELKLFLCSSADFGAQTSKLCPHPDRKHLGYWWNVWDHNDFVSYSVKGVVEEVDDEAYNSGMDVVGAHVGYLVLPSFYRKFAAKLRHARANDQYAAKSKSTSAT